MVHAVKIYPEYYEAVKSGKKPFEVRKNDRDYKVGDILALNEFEPDGAGTGEYSGRAIIARISYVLANSELCKPGYGWTYRSGECCNQGGRGCRRVRRTCS